MTVCVDINEPVPYVSAQDMNNPTNVVFIFFCQRITVTFNFQENLKSPFSSLYYSGICNGVIPAGLVCTPTSSQTGTSSLNTTCDRRIGFICDKECAMHNITIYCTCNNFPGINCINHPFNNLK